MQHPQGPRIDLAELKLHIVKKIGVERSRRYFYYLGRFLSQKLTKSEFDKSCYRLLGKENLFLHNKLIRSILRNTSLARSSPSVQNRNDHVYSNGKAESMLHQRLCNRNTENGDLSSFAYERSNRFAVEEMRILDKGQVAAPVSRANEAKEERGSLILSTSTIVAPLGIPFCSASVGRICRTVPVSTRADIISCYGSCELSDKEILRKRMENIAIAHGLEGASPECCSMLNNMLDVYLKNLIKSCVGFAGTRCTNVTPGKQSLEQHHVSLLDFRVAMELNPHQLGEDWPLLRERILMRSFEEREGVRK